MSRHIKTGIAAGVKLFVYHANHPTLLDPLFYCLTYLHCYHETFA